VFGWRRGAVFLIINKMTARTEEELSVWEHAHFQERLEERCPYDPSREWDDGDDGLSEDDVESSTTSELVEYESDLASSD
jgi:hypothetical protein